MRKSLILFLFATIYLFIFPVTIKYYEKATVLDIISVIKPAAGEEDILRKENYAVIINSGKYGGKQVIIESKVFKKRELNLNIKKKDSVIVEIENNDGIISYRVARHDNSMGLIMLVIVVMIITGVFFEIEGLKTIGYMVIFFGTAYFLYFALFEGGAPPIFTGSVILLIFLAIYAVLFKNSKKEKKIIVIGTLVPFFIFMILNMILISKFDITGFVTKDMINSAEIIRKFDLKGIVSTSIMFILFSISMLIAVLISDNLERNREHIENRALFKETLIFSKKIYGILIFFVTIFSIGVSYFEYFVFYMSNKGVDIMMYLNSEYMVVTVLRYSIIMLAIAGSVIFNALYGAKIYGEREQN